MSTAVGFYLKNGSDRLTVTRQSSSSQPTGCLRRSTCLSVDFLAALPTNRPLSACAGLRESPPSIRSHVCGPSRSYNLQFELPSSFSSEIADTIH